MEDALTPVLYLQLEPKDFGFAAGYRYLVEMVDAPVSGDRYFFADVLDKGGRIVESARARAEAFIVREGCRGITIEEMATCRRHLGFLQ